MDQDYVEYYPHIVLLHNKAELQDFMPTTLNKMKVLHIYIAHFKIDVIFIMSYYFVLLVNLFQEFYNKVFSNSRLQTHSGINMDHCSTESGLNLFLISFKNKEGMKLIFKLLDEFFTKKY